MTIKSSLRVALAADTVSIGLMEIVDNAVMLVIPGAMSSGVGSALFWATMILSLFVAGIVALPVNRWLVSKGKGHAVAHHQHTIAMPVSQENPNVKHHH
jgi:hypothetical protein